MLGISTLTGATSASTPRPWLSRNTHGRYLFKQPEPKHPSPNRNIFGQHLAITLDMGNTSQVVRIRVLGKPALFFCPKTPAMKGARQAWVQVSTSTANRERRASSGSYSIWMACGVATRLACSWFWVCGSGNCWIEMRGFMNPCSWKTTGRQTEYFPYFKYIVKWRSLVLSYL